MSEHHHQHQHQHHEHPRRLTTRKLVFGIAVVGALIAMVIYMFFWVTPNDNVVDENAPKVQTPSK